MKKSTLLFLVILLFACMACEKNENLTVIKNVNGYTFSGDSVIKFTTMIIADGKVYHIGDDDLAESHTKAAIIDGEGKTLLPGLTDAHCHVFGLGFQKLQVDVTGIESLEATLDSISAYANANPDLEWIQGGGWNQTLWPQNSFPTANDLDGIVSEKPVWLSRIDGHAGWANSKALQLAGLSRDTPDPSGGKIIRDKKGNPTGVLVDAAMGYMESVVPEHSKKEYEMALEKALEEMAEMGLTSVHDAGISPLEWEIYKEFADQGKLTTRIYAMIGGAGEVFDTLAKDGPIPSYSNDILSLQSVKLYADGALGSRGAAMLEPYSDDPGNEGLLFIDQDTMNKLVFKVAKAGFQVNVHAIGDKANREVINAFAAVDTGLGLSDLRNRVEHAQVVSLEDIPRFKEHNVIASMQPTHATSDMNMAEDRVGPQRIKGAYAWRTFLDQGTVVAAGSDFPVEYSNPFFGLYSAVTRMDHNGNPDGGWYPEQKLTRKEALRAFTLNAAYAGHQETILGSLEEGKWADFIMIDKDYFEIPESEIWKIKVLGTWVAGKQVF